MPDKSTMATIDPQFIINRQGKCECGCGGDAPIAKMTNRRVGHVKGQPVRFILGHRWRLWELPYHQEDRGHTSPCWIYDGQINPITQYGYVGNMAAYKLSYERAKGPVPAGLELDHLCRVRPCINPDHLEPVTHVVNVRRSPLVGKAPKLSLRALNPDQDAEIAASPLSNRALARIYGTSHESIRQARKRAGA